MKTKLFVTASAIAIMAISPAFADNNPDDNHKASTGSMSKDVENAWEEVKKDTAEAYEDIKAILLDGSEDKEASTVVIDYRKTASGMIGTPVLNDKNERVGTVKDIILDADGKAALLVVADGEFPGLDGKLTAFDYRIIRAQNTDGEVIMPLTEETIDKVAEFSYDRDDQSERIRVIPANGYSVAEILDGQLVNQKNETVAQIDNVSFTNGQANQLVVAFDQVLGFGGKHAALQYDDAQMVRDGETGLDFKLSASQTAQFESFKKTATN